MGTNLMLLSCLIAAGTARSPTAAIAQPMTNDARAIQRNAELNTLESRHTSVKLALADRLKISFFERIQPVADTGYADDASIPLMVERVELTGEYTVQEDGNIFLPLLGEHSVGEQNLRQVQESLAHRFVEIFGREATVSVAMLERAPVFVVGPVANPGTFKFMPGMTVLHALALAGGLEKVSSQTQQYRDSLRETERLRRANEKLKQLLARGAVLQAERGGVQATAPQELIDLAGAEGAARMLTEMAHIRALNLSIRQLELRAYEAATDSIKRELQSVRKRVEHIEENVRGKEDRLNIMRSARHKGAASAHSMLLAQSEFSDSQALLESIMATLAQTDLRLAQAESDRSKLQATIRIELERDILETQREILEEQLTADTSRQMLNALGRITVRAPLAMMDTVFEISRRTSRGPEIFLADDSVLLQPGDVIRIRGYQETALTR